MTPTHNLLVLVKILANDDLGHYVSELLMLYFDIVKLLRFNLSGDDGKKLQKILKTVLLTNNFSYFSQSGYIYIFKSGLKLDQSKIQQPAYLGKQLGFPDCCIQSHLSAEHRDRQIANIKITPNNDWRLNVFYHESLYHLIPHWPCSFNCQASIKMADDFWQQLQAVLPEICCEMAQLLKGNFWHVYEIGDNHRMKTKFANDLVFKITGQKISEQEFHNFQITHQPIYNQDPRFASWLEKIKSSSLLKIDSATELIIDSQGARQLLNLPAGFKQLTQFVTFI